MPRTSNQKLKILYLLDYLNTHTDENRAATTEELIEYLENIGISAERKSIYSDIDALRTYGADIEQKRTKTTGYYIASRDFELPELKLLVDAVQSSKFITEKKSRSLIKKIEKLASAGEAKQLDRQVNVADRVKTMNESIYYYVDDIHNAISENKKISFRYFEWNEKKEKVFRREGKKYTVSPYSLLWDDENYYLIAFDDEKREKRHFRVDKMTGISVCDEVRDMSAVSESGIVNYSKKLFGMFGGEEKMVTLSCENGLSGVIIDRFGKDTAFRSEIGKPCFKISVNVVESPTFFSWVAMFAGRIKIVAPESTRKAYGEFIEKAAEAAK